MLQPTMAYSIVQLLVLQPEKLDFEKIEQMVLQVRTIKNSPRVCDNNNTSDIFHLLVIIFVILKALCQVFPMFVLWCRSLP